MSDRAMLMGNRAGLQARRPELPLRLFLYVTVIACIVYAIVSTGTMGGCLGGVNPDGSFIDGQGKPTGSAPMCIIFELRPQAYVFALLAVIAVSALLLIRRRQELSRSTAAITASAITAIALVGLGFCVYHSLPVQDFLIGDWRTSHDVSLPWLSNATVVKERQ